MRKMFCLFAAAVVLVVIAASPPARAADDEKTNHRAPISIRVTFTDGSMRESRLIAQSPFASSKPNPELRFNTPTGQVVMWMDSLVDIVAIENKKDVNKSSAVFIFKTGEPRRLFFGGFTEKLLVQNDDGTREIIELNKVERLQVLGDDGRALERTR